MKSTHAGPAFGRRMSRVGTWLMVSTGVLGTGVLTAAVLHDQQEADDAFSQAQTSTDDAGSSALGGDADADASSGSDSGSTDTSDSEGDSDSSTSSDSGAGGGDGYASSGSDSRGSTHARTQGS